MCNNVSNFELELYFHSLVCTVWLMLSFSGLFPSITYYTCTCTAVPLPLRPSVQGYILFWYIFKCWGVGNEATIKCHGEDITRSFSMLGLDQNCLYWSCVVMARKRSLWGHGWFLPLTAYTITVQKNIILLLPATAISGFNAWKTYLLMLTQNITLNWILPIELHSNQIIMALCDVRWL